MYPLSVLMYALMENPRPSALYWKIMLYYTEFIIFLKFLIQLPALQLIFGHDYLKGYKDPYKIGFNLYNNSYSEDFTSYVIWDIICILLLLLHKIYLSSIGLD